MHFHQFRRFVSFLFCFAFLGTTLSSTPSVAALQSPPDPQDRLLAQLRQQTDDTLQVARHAETGQVRFLAANPAHPVARSPDLSARATPEQASRQFLASYGTLFGLRDQARELTVMHTESFGSKTFVRFQQRYQNVPIIGGEITVQTDAARNVVSANGELLPNLDLSVVPALDANAATRTALASVAKTYRLAPGDLRAAPPSLWVYNPALLGGPGLRRAALVWRTEVTTPLSAVPVREFVLIDAHLGAIALRFNQIAHAKIRFVCDNASQIDEDRDEKNNCPPSKYVRSEGQGPTGIADVDLAYEYAGHTYDYFFNNFGRDSLDGRGMPLVSLVNYCQPPQGEQSNCPYENAFWDGQQMTYGAGYAAGDDVVGHELAHGFTEFSSHLFYYYQSGAINESMSDVFGELMDQTNNAGNDSGSVKWELGEDLPASIGVIRDMSNPTRFENPDWTGSSYYYGGDQDSGGVHTNSGVNNKAAYLMTDGGSFRGVNVSPIGPQKTGAIYFLVSVAFLTSGSDFQDLHSYLQAACSTLASSGAYGITAGDCAQVKKAADATGMDVTPPSASVPEAPICATGQSTSDVFFDDFENPALGNWASSATSGNVNEWYYPAYQNPFAEFFDGRYATSGVGNIWGNNHGDPAPEDDSAPAPPPADYSIAMTRDVQVPPNGLLHFRHAVEFEYEYDYYYGLLTHYDGGVVEYSTNGGASWSDAGPLFDDSTSVNGYNASIDSDSTNPLAGRDVFGNVSQGYYSVRANLGPLAGQNVRFRFRIGTDPYVGFYGWFIDDFRVYSCTGTPPSVSLKTPSLTVDKRAGGILVEATLNAATTRDVTVPLTFGGSAVAGTDYAAFGSQLVIPAGSMSGKLFVSILNNGRADGDKTLVVSLGTPSGASLGGVSSTTITIRSERRVYLPMSVK